MYPEPENPLMVNPRLQNITLDSVYAMVWMYYPALQDTEKVNCLWVAITVAIFPIVLYDSITWNWPLQIPARQAGKLHGFCRAISSWQCCTSSTVCSITKSSLNSSYYFFYKQARNTGWLQLERASFYECWQATPLPRSPIMVTHNSIVLQLKQ